MRTPSLRAAHAPHAQRWEVGDIARRYGPAYRCSSEHRRVLRALAQCRTAALGGHREQCASWGRHAPLPTVVIGTVLGASHVQAVWRARSGPPLADPAIPPVFTLPHELNALTPTSPAYAPSQTVAATLKPSRTILATWRRVSVTAAYTSRRRSSITPTPLHRHRRRLARWHRWRRSKGRRIFPSPRWPRSSREARPPGRGPPAGRASAPGRVPRSEPSRQQPHAARAKAWYVYAKAPLPDRSRSNYRPHTHRIAISNERIRRR
jgi:hypothetical protein